MSFPNSGLLCNFPANLRALAPIIPKAAVCDRLTSRLHFLALSPRMASKNKTLIDLFQPARPAKRLKPDSSSSDDITTKGPASSSSLTAEQKARVEFQKLLAKAKRNRSICSGKVSDSNSKGEGVKLEELLVDDTWRSVLPSELQKPYAVNLCKFVESEISAAAYGGCGAPMMIYPPTHLIFNALNSTPFDRVKVVILGQDPYHGPGQAMGLSFSVPQGVKVPSSLVNIFKELNKDVGCSIASHGNLEKWAVQGVLLLNAVLTVRNHQANSHAKKGWEQFTDAVIQAISQKKKGVVFLLWGNSAQQKARLVDVSKHHILRAAHPSGLSAHKGFFGCRHFSRTNQLLEEMGIPPIDWQL